MGNSCKLYSNAFSNESNEEKFNPVNKIPINYYNSTVPTNSSCLLSPKAATTLKQNIHLYNTDETFIQFDKQFRQVLSSKGISMFDKNFFDEIPSTLINLRKRLPKLIVNMHNKNISESLIANFPLYQKDAVIFKNGAIYQGQWSKDVKICGNGIMYLPKESILLEGYFIKNSLISGRVYLTEDSYYEGELCQNVFNGYGKYIKNEGEYEGQFLNGFKNGNGTLRYKNVFIYKGNFKNDLFEGKGYINFILQKYEYFGNFNKSMFEGEGELKTPNGKYIGCFINSQLEGEGIFSWNTHQCYKGQYRQNKKNGNGVYKDKVRDVEIKGIWVDGQPNGITEVLIKKIKYKVLYRKGEVIECSINNIAHKNILIDMVIENEDYEPKVLFRFNNSSNNVSKKDSQLFFKQHEIKPSFESYFKRPIDSFGSVPF